MHHQNSIRIARLRSLIFSVYDGFFNSLMVGFGETYFAAYAVFLGASNFELGFLSSLPPFLAGVSQFSTPGLMKKIPSRRRFVSLGALCQALLIVPIFFSHALTPAVRIEFLVLCVTLYTIAPSITGPAWNSWMGDLVRVSERSKYFSRRNRLTTVGSLLAMLGAGYLLRHFTDVGMELKGFGVVMMIAFAARFTSFYFLSQKYDPPASRPAGPPPGLMKFIKELPLKNQGILILYMSAVNFGVYVSAAYFTPYMLRELHFSYMTFTLVNCGAALARIIVAPFWGEICDKLGARRVIVACGFLISLTTVPWLFTRDPWLLFFSQMYTGMVWAGFELSTFTFLLDATEPAERIQISSYLNIFQAAAGLIGGFVGALLFAGNVHFENPFFVVFGLSAFMRLFALFTFGQRLKEVRVVSPVSAKDILLKATGFRSAMGMTSKMVVMVKRRKSHGVAVIHALNLPAAGQVVMKRAKKITQAGRDASAK